jgi:sigma-E factor negative regulatory protein RseB
VVSSPAGGMSSSRIWHVCTGDQQFERIDSLTGGARTTLRHNDRVLTFLPESRVVRSELVETLRLFPNLLKGDDLPLADLYQPRTLGVDRVAGHEADVVQLTPRDGLRFGLRVWSERRTGLVLKLQTLDSAGRVLEQASFSELQIDVSIKPDRIAQMMERTQGYQVQRQELVRTTAAAEGWALREAVPGFRPMGCLKRPAAAAGAGSAATGAAEAIDGSMQWIFSDGLATVSLFVEPFDAKRHTQAVQAVSGATHMLSRRMNGAAQAWWLTAVGEVPLGTLLAFAQSLERRAPAR